MHESYIKNHCGAHIDLVRNYDTLRNFNQYT